MTVRPIMPAIERGWRCPHCRSPMRTAHDYLDTWRGLELLEPFLVCTRGCPGTWQITDPELQAQCAEP
jgi:hypothetical protein